MVTRSNAPRRSAAPKKMIRPRPTRVTRATAPVPEGVFVSAQARAQMPVTAGVAIEPVDARRRAQGAEVLDVESLRPDWADLQRVPPLQVVISRERIEHRARQGAEPRGGDAGRRGHALHVPVVHDRPRAQRPHAEL